MERRGAQWYTAPWFPLIIVGGIIVLHYIGVLQPIESLLARAVQPIQAFVYSGGSAEESELTDEELLAQLQDENTALQLENSRLLELLDETQILSEQLAFLKDSTFDSVQAKVTSRSTDRLAQSIIINRGSKHGVQKGDAVIVNEGILVGIVHSVESNTSTVLLVTSYNNKVGAKVQNETQSPGIVEGEHNISLRLTFVPQTDTLTVGDSIITSGNDENIPTGLLIGTIQEVFQEPGSLFQEASVEPLFDATQLRIVSVVRAAL